MKAARGPLLLLAAALLGGVLGWRLHKPPPPRVVEEDRNRDGRADRWVERDPDTRALTRVTEDLDFNGRVDRIEVWAAGRIQRVDTDSDRDGTLDTTNTLGAQGQVLFTLTDRDWNSIPERWIQRNSHGELSGEWIDPNQDTAPDRFRSFDRAGRCTDEATDADADGLFELNRVYNTRWPEGSHPVRIERDEDHDGLYERRESYDREGRLLAVNEDTDGDGVRDHFTLFRGAREVAKEGFDRDGNGFFEEWRFPVPGGVRVGRDLNDDYDLDAWDRPGPPEGWCQARCPGGALAGAAPNVAQVNHGR
ncbi:MAG: hypothetical protein HY909_11500 [Deltaproteobacteria bacterium]|nr:hypothetical protein [Deltaproteobacteria bacterium]